jgi:hypothetical protein
METVAPLIVLLRSPSLAPASWAPVAGASLGSLR